MAKMKMDELIMVSTSRDLDWMESVGGMDVMLAAVGLSLGDSSTPTTGDGSGSMAWKSGKDGSGNSSRVAAWMVDGEHANRLLVRDGAEENASLLDDSAKRRRDVFHRFMISIIVHGDSSCWLSLMRIII